MEKFKSRDNEGIQILLSNSDGLIEVSYAYVHYCGKAPRTEHLKTHTQCAIL